MTIRCVRGPGRDARGADGNLFRCAIPSTDANAYGSAGAFVEWKNTSRNKTETSQISFRAMSAAGCRKSKLGLICSFPFMNYSWQSICISFRSFSVFLWRPTGMMNSFRWCNLAGMDGTVANVKRRPCVGVADCEAFAKRVTAFGYISANREEMKFLVNPWESSFYGKSYLIYERQTARVEILWDKFDATRILRWMHVIRTEWLCGR